MRRHVKCGSTMLGERGLIGLASGDWFEFRWPRSLTMPGAGPCQRSIYWQ